eukprot:GGOE01056819.1.p2 GENE.GGOE01056819.1~~GGOE01056819.1.p2  ORF type:complete len:201 (-),score=68.03 GGOE01056819.1:216-818(-)
MRFAFCGGLDTPDWVLAAVTVLARLSSLRLRVVCGEVASSLCQGPVQWPKVQKIVSAANLDDSQTKQLLTCLQFILGNAVRFDVDARVLADEMTMIGLPKESADQLVEVYTANREHLAAVAVGRTLRLPCATDYEWRVDVVVGGSAPADVVQRPVVALRMSVPKGTDGPHPLALEMSVEKFHALYAELKAAREVMAEAEK